MQGKGEAIKGREGQDPEIATIFRPARSPNRRVEMRVGTNEVQSVTYAVRLAHSSLSLSPCPANSPFRLSHTYARKLYSCIAIV